MCRENDVMRDLVAGKIDSNQAILELSSLLRRLARWAARKHNILDHAEDIEQELALAILGKAAEKWTPGLSISSYMTGWAWRIASSMWQSKMREESFDELYSKTESEAFSEGNLDAIGIQDEQSLYAMIDSEFLRRVPDGFSIDGLDRALSEFSVPDLKPSKSKIKNNRHLNPNKVLRKIRHAVGMTRADMAASMGISLGRYAGYESGKIRSVPDEIYKRADLVYANMRHRARLTDELDKLPMSAIFQKWCDMLGCTEAETADHLGISQRTMRRWKDDVYKPRHSIVLRHHIKIKSLSSALNCSLESKPGL